MDIDTKFNISIVITVVATAIMVVILGLYIGYDLGYKNACEDFYDGHLKMERTENGEWKEIK